MLRRIYQDHPCIIACAILAIIAASNSVAGFCLRAALVAPLAMANNQWGFGVSLETATRFVTWHLF